MLYCNKPQEPQTGATVKGRSHNRRSGKRRSGKRRSENGARKIFGVKKDVQTR